MLTTTQVMGKVLASSENIARTIVALKKSNEFRTRAPEDYKIISSFARHLDVRGPLTPAQKALAYRKLSAHSQFLTQFVNAQADANARVARGVISAPSVESEIGESEVYEGEENENDEDSPL